MPRIAVLIMAVTVILVGAPAAQAADRPVPSSDVCSETATATPYACMGVSKRRVPSGDPVIFSGTLSSKARKSLADWTKGDNIVCLTRYATKPAAGGWPSNTLESACTTVRGGPTFRWRTCNAGFMPPATRSTRRWSTAW